MSTDHRAAALDRLRELHERLQAGEWPERDAIVTECEQLIKAVETFHMEAIRFRMYGLQRRLTSDQTPASADTLSTLEAARAALGAAGFKTR